MVEPPRRDEDAVHEDEPPGHPSGPRADGADRPRQDDGLVSAEYHYSDEPEPRARRRARWTLAAVLLALFAAMLGYRVLTVGRLEETALFYVGLPALIAVMVVLLARPRSPVGVATGATAIGLLLAGPLLGEGLICLVIASPLFFAVAGFIGWCVDRTINTWSAGPSALVVAPVIALLALEGVAGVSYLPRGSSGSAERVVDAAPEQVAAALAAAPEYGEVESAFLTMLPFPAPVAARGTGLEVGAQRVIEFTPHHASGPGSPPARRGMTLEVVESDVDADSGRVVFRVTDDTTLARWLDLRQAEPAWRAEGEGTRLSWTLSYERTYDPSWYFGPVQEYAVGEAAGYLADTFAASAVSAGPPTGGRPAR
ncbi:hypothetical protein [Nocardiopsis rhodophaea]|uniref:hypothetical protein n=1 Tax=Nocardiopsis rhodophaea TaxID=280238 RepID=UPI0031D77C0B